MIRALYACQMEMERVNVNYEIECMREGCDFVYCGETYRNAFCRGREHLRGLDKRSDDSVLMEHIRDYHEGDFSNPPCQQYKMSVTQYHSKTLDRLVTEAVNIDTASRPTMNRKRGFRSNQMLRLKTSLGTT